MLQNQQKRSLLKLKNNDLDLLKKENLDHVLNERTTETKTLKLKKVIHSKTSLEKKQTSRKTSKNLGSPNTITKVLRINVKKMTKNLGTIIKIIKKNITIRIKTEPRMAIRILVTGIVNQNLNLTEL